MIRWRWIMSLPALVLLVPMATAAPEEDLPATTFFGSVLDSATNAPIFNATVYFSNHTAETFFFGRTDEDGMYSVQVGKGGTYQIAVMHDAYEYVSTSSNISTWEVKRLDHRLRHYVDNCNIRVMENGRLTPFRDATVELEEDVPYGSFHRIGSDEGGWANITLAPGNYTLTVYAPHTEKVIRHLHLGEGEYRIDVITLRPAPVGSGAPHVLIDRTYAVPARSAMVMGIASSEEYSLFVQYRSDLIVDCYTVPGYCLEPFLNWTRGSSLDNESIFKYDFGLTGGRNGGIPCSTWTDPYYIVIVNNESRTSKVELTLKYDWGSFEVSEPDIVLLDEERQGVLERIIEGFDTMIAIYFLLLTAIIAIIIYIGIRKDRKENADPISDPHHGRQFTGRSPRGRDRSARRYRWDADRSFR